MRTSLRVRARTQRQISGREETHSVTLACHDADARVRHEAHAGVPDRSAQHRMTICGNEIARRLDAALNVNYRLRASSERQGGGEKMSMHPCSPHATFGLRTHGRLRL